MIGASLTEKQEQLIAEIKKKAAIINSEQGPIWDGVADCESYAISRPRVVWILKEPYDTDPGPEGWSHPDFLADLSVTKINTSLTWRRVNETMFSIREQKHYDESNLADRNCLKDIAWINLSKMAGKSISDGQFKKQFKLHWAEIVKKQIDVYDPNIIIFGNTFDICKKELFPKGYELILKKPLVHLYKTGKMLLIYAYHPGWWGVKDAEYVNSIVDSITVLANACK